MAKTVNFALSLMDASVKQKSIDYNESMPIVDALLTRSVEDATLTVPPASPGDGLIWGVPAAATGAWHGYDGELAMFIGGGWVFMAAPDAVPFRDKENENDVISDGLVWSAVASGGGASSVVETHVFDGTYSDIEVTDIHLYSRIYIVGADLVFSSSGRLLGQLSDDGGATYLAAGGYRRVRSDAGFDGTDVIGDLILHDTGAASGVYFNSQMYLMGHECPTILDGEESMSASPMSLNFMTQGSDVVHDTLKIRHSAGGTLNSGTLTIIKEV